MDKDLFRSLRHRNYRLFFWGQIVSVTGTWLQITALPWLIYRLTHSALLLGLVGFLSQIFVLVLSPLAGIASDHHDRKRLLLLTQSLAMAQALALAWLTMTGRIGLWHIIVLSILLGLINAFDMTFRQAFVTDLVPREELMNAIGLNSTVFNGARLVGPALAGILIAAHGEGWCFLINGVSFVFVIAALAGIVLRGGAHAPDATGSVREKFMAGIAYVRASRRTGAILALLSVTGLIAVFPMTLMPIFVNDIFRMNASGLGLFMSALGAGAIVGTLSIAGRQSLEGIERTIVWSAPALGVLVIAFAAVRNVPAACAVLACAGYAVSLQMGLTNTFLQTTTPDALRGRVLGFFIMAFMGFAPVGSLAAGALAHRIGAPWTVTAGGSIAIVAAMFLKDRILLPPGAASSPEKERSA